MNLVGSGVARFNYAMLPSAGLLPIMQEGPGAATLPTIQLCSGVTGETTKQR